MEFAEPLATGTLIKRYKRFLADVRLEDGSQITIHCPNTGSMLNCNTPDSQVWFSTSDNPKRKYPHTWESIPLPNGARAGINTSRANSLVQEAIQQGVIRELQGYDTVKSEVPYGEQKSRIDFLLSKPSDDCYVEVKNVTLGEDGGQGYFPDAVSTRGTKHLQELIHVKQQGHRAVLLYCVQHTGIERVSAAKHIDSVYAETLGQAIKAGLEVYAYGATLTPKKIALEKPIKFI